MVAACSSHCKSIVFDFVSRRRIMWLIWLFYTCIQVRKLFSISFILNEFPCGEVHIPCLCNQQTNTEVFCVMHCSFLHNLEQRQSVFARSCVEKYSVHRNISDNGLLQKAMSYLRFTVCRIIKYLKEIMTNVLSCSVRIYVSNIMWFPTVCLMGMNLRILPGSLLNKVM